MGKLYTIKKLIKAVKDKKSLFVFSEKDNTQCLSIPLEKCNINLSINLQVQNIGTQFTKINLNNYEEKCISKSLYVDIPYHCHILYVITILFYVPFSLGTCAAIIDDIYIGNLKEIYTGKYSIDVFDILYINRIEYF